MVETLRVKAATNRRFIIQIAIEHVLRIKCHGVTLDLFLCRTQLHIISMAQASSNSKDIKKNSASSDFSLISGSGESILLNASWPKQDDMSFTTVEPPRSVPPGETCNSDQILASHYALATAYQRVTKKLAEAEQRSQQLMMQDSLRGQENLRSARMSGCADSQTNYAMPPDLEASVNEAWEAYNEKCRECRQLREELEEVKQRLNNTEHCSRIQNLREDVLREKAKQDDVVRKLEKTKMEAGHLEKKEIMAREELEKEREYQRSIIVGAEKKHRELEQRIEELETNLASEKSLTEDLRRREKDGQIALEDEFNAKKEVFNVKIRELEERNIALKEEVVVLVSMQTDLTNGPTSGSAVGINGVTDFAQTSTCSTNFDEGKDDATLEFDLHLLKTELDNLKRKAAEQADMLHTLCRNTKFHHLLRNVNQLQLSGSEDPFISLSKLKSGPGSLPALSGGNILLKRKKTIPPKTRNCGGLIYADGSTESGGSLPMNSQEICDANNELIPNGQCIPPKKKNEHLDSCNTPILKTTEEFIRGLSREANMQNRGNIRSSLAHENLESNVIFPPTDGSRIVHATELGDPNMTSTYPTTLDNSFTLAQSSQKPCPVGNALADGSQSSLFVNGNAMPVETEQLRRPHNMQNSLPIMDDESGIFYSAVASNSLSSTDTLVFSPVGKTSNAQLSKSVHNDSYTPSTSSALVWPTTAQGLSEVSPITNEIPRPSRRLQAAAGPNFDTAAAGCMSSDEDGDPESFEQIGSLDAGSHRPREFVVPKVVRASDSVSPPGQPRKAFLDSGFGTPTAQMRPRPSTRAKPKATDSNRARPRTSSRENRARRQGGWNAEDAAAVCPVCYFEYPSDWTEGKKRRHVNAHFSDEDGEIPEVD